MSKDKFTIRRRAAFDTDEKDVTKEDVKTPLLRTSSIHHEVTIIMKTIPYMIGSALSRSYNEAQGWLRVPCKEKTLQCYDIQCP